MPALNILRGTGQDDGTLSWHYFLGTGLGVWAGVAGRIDDLVVRARTAVLSRQPRVAPADALPYIAENRNLDHPARFTVDQVRDYLASAWALWRKAGTRTRMLDELGNLGLNDCEIVSWRDLADAGQPQAFGGDFSCWFLRIKQPNPWRPVAKWDSGVLWDQPQLWWDAGRHDPELWAAILRVIAKWKPAASSCRFVEIVLRVDIFGNPTEVARAPIHEWWELDARGNAPNYYNEGYL